jgi:hypothetical protein
LVSVLAQQLDGSIFESVAYLSTSSAWTDSTFQIPNVFASSFIDTSVRTYSIDQQR